VVGVADEGPGVDEDVGVRGNVVARDVVVLGGFADYEGDRSCV